MSYSINGKIPNPNLVRFLSDRPTIMDRYDDVAILRQNLLNYQRVKVPPNELIVKKLKKKARGLKKTKNLRGEIGQNLRQQRRFEKGERRDKPEQEPRIVGDPIQAPAGAAGISFDPETEQAKIRAQLQIAQGNNNVELQRIQVAAAQLDLNRELARRQEREAARDRALQGRRLGLEDDRGRIAAAQEDQRIAQEDERIRQILDRHRVDDERYRDLQVERDNERERDQAIRDRDIVEQRRVRREAVAEDRRRQAAEQEARQREVEAQIQGQIEGQTIRRSAEIEQQEERNQFELARGQQERDERTRTEEARRLQLETLERRRDEQIDVLQAESRLNRQEVDRRINEVDREREQRQQQREAEYLQRGLHEIDGLISRRLSEAEDRLRRNIPDPAPERPPQVIVLQPPPSAPAPEPAPQRPDLSQEISDTIRQQLAGVRPPSPSPPSSPRDRASGVSTGLATPVPEAVDTAPAQVPSVRIPEIESGEQDLTASSLDRQFAGDTQAAQEQVAEEAGVAIRGIDELDESVEASTEDSEEEEAPGIIETIATGGRDLFDRAAGAYEDLTRPAIGEQTGGQLRTGTGELVLGLGQEIEDEIQGFKQGDSVNYSSAGDTRKNGTIKELKGSFAVIDIGDRTTRVPYDKLKKGTAFQPPKEPEPQSEDVRTTSFRGRQVPAELGDRYQPPSRQVSPARGRPVSPTQVALFSDLQGAERGNPTPALKKETEKEKAAREYKESVRAVGAVKRFKTREPKFPGEKVAPQRAAEYKRLGGDREVARLQKESDRKKEQLESIERNIKFGLADSSGRFTGTRSKIETLEEGGGRGAPPLTTGGLLEETEGRGVGRSQVRNNYQEYQSLKSELDTFKGAGGARVRGGGTGSRGIPYTITNISDRNLKKLGPGETVNIQSVLGNDNIRYFTSQTRGDDPTNLSSSELYRLLREGKIRISKIR